MAAVSIRQISKNALQPQWVNLLRRSPDRHSRPKQKKGRDGTEPAHPNPLNDRQTRRRPGRRKRIPNHVIPGHDFRTPLLQHVEAVRVQAREAEQLAHALHEHADYRQRDPADPLLDRPPVDQHAHRYHEAQRWEAGVEAVFGDAFVAFADVFFNYVVGLGWVSI